MLPMPKMKDNISLLDFALRLKATKIGMIGNMHGESIEITPVKKEIKGNDKEPIEGNENNENEG